MKYIASWSGGKDSTAQIILAHENNEPLDLIIFSEVMFDNETSGELPEHIAFIKNKCIPLFESWGYETKILHADLTYMDIFLREPTRGKWFGSGLITGFPMSGKCQINKSVKILPITKFLKGFEEDYTQYIGIAIDEPKRLKKLEGTNRISLLAKYEYTEQMAYDLCKKYDLLSPTYSYSKRGGCWFCPNAGKGELRHLRTNHKDLWNKLLELETTPNLIGNIWNTLTKTSIYDMEAKFLAEDIRMKNEVEKIPKDDTNAIDFKALDKAIEIYKTEKIPKEDTSVIVANKQSINRHLKELDKIFDAFRKNYFYQIGFGLYWFDDTGAYQQISSKTYDNIADFAKDRYGISKATTYQYLAVIKKFGKINPETGEIDAIRDEYKDYKSTALIIMAGMTDEQLAQCSPDMKTKELKAIRDGVPLIEDRQNGNKEHAEKPKSPVPKSNMQPLFKIESVSDLENRSKEIMDAIKKVLMQDNGTNYSIDISMTWD